MPSKMFQNIANSHTHTHTPQNTHTDVTGKAFVIVVLFLLYLGDAIECRILHTHTRWRSLSPSHTLAHTHSLQIDVFVVYGYAKFSI